MLKLVIEEVLRHPIHLPVVAQNRGVLLQSEAQEEHDWRSKPKHMKGSTERCLLGQKNKQTKTANFRVNPLCQATKRYLNNG